MLKVLILICSAQVAAPNCQADNAIDVIWGPDATNEITCAFTGQAYVAATPLAVGPDQYVKVQCMRRVEAVIDQAAVPPGEVDCASAGKRRTTTVASAAGIPMVAGIPGPKPIWVDPPVATGAATWRTIALGTYRSAGALRDALRDDGCEVGRLAGDALAQAAFGVSRTKTDVDLAVLSVSQLGFDTEGASRAEIYERAARLGLALCPAEIGPQLRRQYLDQPVGEFLHIAMNPVDTDGGKHVLFIVGNGGAGLALIGADADAGVRVPLNVRYVFLRPR